MKVVFTPAFVRQLKKLPADLQEEALESVNDFRIPKNHKRLKVHKLHGQFKKYYSFSVNYKVRIVFDYLSRSEAILMAIGDHDMYK